MSNRLPPSRFSSQNPFRTPLLTPNPTGTSVVSSAPSYHTALPFSHTLLTPTPTGMSTVSSAPSYHTAAEPNENSDDEDTPEALPELTPTLPSRAPFDRPLPSLLSLNNNSGSIQGSPLVPRSTLSAAPHSPFIAPPSDLPPDLTLHDIPEDAPPAYSLTPDISGGETFVEQDPPRPLQQDPEPVVQPPQPNPYPSLEPPSSFPERRLSQLSDFEAPSSPTGSLQQRPRYAPPPGRPPTADSARQQPRHDPPPAPPPSSRPRAASTPSSAGAGSSAPPARNGYPTSTPTPGHPLLRNGRTLIYPESHRCQKCKLLCCPLPFLSLFLTPFIDTNLRRQQHGLQKLRPFAPVPQVLGPVWQAVLVNTCLEPVGRAGKLWCESESARSHVSAAASCV